MRSRALPIVAALVLVACTGDQGEARPVDRLPDETWLYPGHGNDSVLGNERPHLAEWRERGW